MTYITQEFENMYAMGFDAEQLFSDFIQYASNDYLCDFILWLCKEYDLNIEDVIPE